MKPFIISSSGSFVSVVLLLFFQYVSTRQSPYYDSSYSYLSMRNEVSGDEKTFCVNYEQWRTDLLPVAKSDAHPLKLCWWGTVGNTNFCKKSSRNFTGCAVALNYRIHEKDRPCASPFFVTNTSFKDFIQAEANELIARNASAGILLVEKGQQFVSRWSDYLFSEFYDPDLNQSTDLPIFFMYSSVFFDSVAKMNRSHYGENLSLRFYRPPSSVWDVSMLLVWLLAVFCVGVGGYWAGHRKICEERSALSDTLQSVSQRDVHIDLPKHKSQSEDDKITTSANCIFIIVIMLIVVGILMLGFYFRNIMVYIFNIILAVVGTFSVHRCLTALTGAFCKCGQCPVCLSMNDVSRSVFRRDLFNYECCSKRPRITSILIFFLSAALCIFWFFFRRNPYAFILLDFINITLCLHVLKGIRFPNLKWLVVLLLCMFVYDIFMVFGTPFLTKNGCSVMLEVAAGTGCSKSTIGYPVAPINSEIPEKFPMLFQVPRLSDPMMPCIDLDVEKEFHPVILGLGDVIVPGYLISFCFTVDFAVPTRHIYGIMSVLGYAVGLVVTFVALTITEMAQPALIYLIPSTLFPIIYVALIRRELGMLWNGNISKSSEEGVIDSESVAPNCSIDSSLTSSVGAPAETGH